MKKTWNIFIEGVPGSGKTTLLNKLSDKLFNYEFYLEGDISPIELAWCAYMTKEQYTQALKDWPDLVELIKQYSKRETDNYYVVAYTKIHINNKEFYDYMEKFEVYGGRLSTKALKDIIIKRFKQFQKTGNVFECSFFQNTIEELMLFALYDEKQIVDTYREILPYIDIDNFLMLRLVNDENHLIENIVKIKEERVNEQGEQIWYHMMTDYLNQSPYGKLHPFKNFDDLLEHFNRRVLLEDKVIEELFKDYCINIESKNYELDKILDYINQD